MKPLKSLAIIGSQGMVGEDLTKYLKTNFEKVVGIDRENYNQYCGHHFDVVINANGNSNKIWANDNVLDDFEASTTSVYKTLFDFPCNTYVYISSADTYENHTSKKFTLESKAINPQNLSPYGLHKYLSECIVRNFTKNYLILRCPMMLGAKLKKGPIYDILHGSRIFVNSESCFQMITTKELSQIINFLIIKDIKKEIFNIGGRGTASINEIGNYLHKSVIFPKDAQTQKYEMNVSKLHRIYPLKTSGKYLQDLLKSYIMLKS